MGEFLEVAIVIKSKKGEKGNEESEEDKKKRSKHGPDGKKKLFVCLKKCPRIFYFGGDEAVVANEVRANKQRRHKHKQAHKHRLLLSSLKAPTTTTAAATPTIQTYSVTMLFSQINYPYTIDKNK